MENPYIIGGIVLLIAAWFFFTIVKGVLCEKQRRRHGDIARFNARMSKQILREEREKTNKRERRSL